MSLWIFLNKFDPNSEVIYYREPETNQSTWSLWSSMEEWQHIGCLDTCAIVNKLRLCGPLYHDDSHAILFLGRRRFLLFGMAWDKKEICQIKCNTYL